MKIAIIGTRGIPNHYGGFEQLAEKLSVQLFANGHHVTVYNSSLHPYKQNTFNNVHIISCYDPEDKLGTFGQFIYDFNCIINTRKQEYDIILQLGYTSSSVWSFLFPKNAKIITNMDGLEWKRTKYNTLTKLFLKQAEKWAVKNSHALIADSLGIKEYIKREYQLNSHYIAYGADICENIDASVLKNYSVTPNQYYLIIARLEPENNIEMVIKGYIMSGKELPLLIIGSTTTKYGTYLKNKYISKNIIFTESIYNTAVLDSLRKFCTIYFHGHSVGGTNPSLLEAMAAQAFICAHNNIFNQAVLGNSAIYFNDAESVCNLVQENYDDDLREKMKSENILAIKQNFTWQSICNAYNEVFTKG